MKDNSLKSRPSINICLYTKKSINTIYKNEGVAGFYKGIKLNSIKSIPEIAIKIF